MSEYLYHIHTYSKVILVHTCDLIYFLIVCLMSTGLRTGGNLMYKIGCVVSASLYLGEFFSETVPCGLWF